MCRQVFHHHHNHCPPWCHPWSSSSSSSLHSWSWPPSILFGQTLRSSRALVLFSGAARWRRLFNRLMVESVEVEEWRKWRMFRWNCKDGSREQRRQWSRSSRISCYIEEGDGRLEQDNIVCQRESEYFGNIVFYSLNPPSPTVKYIFSYCGSIDDTFGRIEIKMMNL